MDNTFTLLSTMSPTIKKRNRNIVHQKVPTKLALKKNIRRSSIFDSLPPTALNNSLVLVEGSTTDTTNSNSTYSGLSIINSSPITISDSDSTKSENCTPFKKTTDKHNKFCKIPNDCGLSESKFNAIDKWVSNVQNENIRPSSFSSNLPEMCITRRKYDFEDLLDSVERTFRLQESGKNTNKNLGQIQSVDKQFSSVKDSSNHEANDLITSKSVKECQNGCTSNMVTSKIKANETVSSSSDVIEGSDDVYYQNKLDARLLDELYGDNGRNTKNMLLPLSERRYRKKKANSHKIAPKTEVKLKPNWSIVHKNPYLDSEQKPQNTPSKQSVTSLEAPWTKRLQALCDSDSSDESFNEKHHRPPGVRLFFSDNKNSCDNKITHKKFDGVLEKPNTYFFNENKSNRNAQNIDPSLHSEKENFSDFSDDETLEDKLARKLKLNKNTKVTIFREHKRKDTEALVKPNTYLPEKEQSDKNLQNTDKLVDSEKETFSHFSDDNATLEARFKKKLGVEKKTKIAVSRKNTTKEIEDDLKNIFSKKCNNFKDRNISPSEVSNDLGNDKLLKKTNICKTKTVKTKVIKKKPLTSSESSDAGGIVNKANSQKYVASKGAKINLDDTCRSFLASLSGCVPIYQCDPSARIFRNSFKMYRSELVTKLFKLYNEKVFGNMIPEDSLIEWSQRMRGTAGYCYCRKITRRTGLIERKVRIVLASKVLDCADRVRDTLIHEMCHAATWIVNEVADGHGSYWKAWAHKVKQTFPELPPIKVCHNYAITTKYTYKCTKCGYSFGRHTKSVDVERKRCGHCYGTFEILINKTTKGGESKSVPVTPKKAATGFALFVKENYATYKSPQLTHGQTMKLLGQKFGELKVSVCKNDEEEA